MKGEEESRRLLAQYLKRKPGKNETKSEIVSAIRSSYLFTDLARMTNVNKRIFKHASLYIHYDYLRQLTSFMPEKGSLALQFSAKESSASLIHFTHSGHGAILQSLGILKASGCLSYSSPSTLYWETEQALEMLGFKTSTEPSVYWIDSSSLDVEGSWIIPNSVKWVVVDSTCWHVQGKEYKVLREKLKAFNVITVRSHVKLDMLGVEYAPLGSIILTSDQMDVHSQSFYQAARLFATTASPEAVPPYLLSAESLKLGAKRVKAFRKSHTIIQEIISNRPILENVVIQLPPHGLYFYMAFRKSHLDIPSIHKKVKLLAEELEVDIRGLESFGFDFFGMQIFKPNRDREFEVCLRISYGASGVGKVKIRKLFEKLLTITD